MSHNALAAPETAPLPPTVAAAAEPGMHVGRAIAVSLELHGIDRVFTIPGESYLAVLDGLRDSPIHNIVCRHEGGAAYMADAYGRASSTVGVAMVTRGPGAANAFVAIHTAWQDASPMVLFVGLIPTPDRDREAFQEFDPRAWFSTQTKRVLVLDSPERARPCCYIHWRAAERQIPAAYELAVLSYRDASPRHCLTKLKHRSITLRPL